jgi:hypothetical protein
MSQEKKFYMNNEESQWNTNCDSKELNYATAVTRSHEGGTSKEVPDSLLIKIPTILSEVEIEICVEKEFKLKKPATYVKNINKHTVITECDLIPHTNKLFIEGYVQKSIYYYNEVSDKSTSKSRLKHTTINIPFRTITEILLENEPIYGESHKNSVGVPSCKAEDNNITESSCTYYSKPYERIYNELEYIKIMETEISNKNINSKALEKQEHHNQLRLKIVIHIGLKVLQKQCVNMSQTTDIIKLVESIIKNKKEHK